MQKKEEIELLETAIKKLNIVKSKRKTKEIIDGIGWVLNVVLKHYYGIRHECTKEELERIFSKKPVKKEERESFLNIINEFNILKYETKAPSKDKAKEILSRFTAFFENKLKVLKEPDTKQTDKKGIFQNLKNIFKKSKTRGD